MREEERFNSTVGTRFSTMSPRSASGSLRGTVQTLPEMLQASYNREDLRSTGASTVRSERVVSPRASLAGSREPRAQFRRSGSPEDDLFADPPGACVLLRNWSQMIRA